MNKVRHNSRVPVTESHRFRKARGLSLIELMVALALGLIIIAALTQLYVSIARTNDEMSKTNSQIENARYAMQYLQNDVVHAGYWGGYIPDYDNQAFEDAPTDAPTLTPNPCNDYSTWNQAYINAVIGIPLEVYSTEPSGCNGIIDDRLAGTDILVVRHADTCVAGVGNCAAPSTPSDKLYFQASNCADEIDLEDLGNEYSFESDPNDLVLTQLDCSTRQEIRRFVQNIYYIRDYAYEAGDGIPTLVRSEFELSGGTLSNQSPVELVEGIEGFQVRLGIDRESHSEENISQSDVISWDDDGDRVFPRNRGDGVAEEQFERCLSDPSCTPGSLSTVEAALSNVVAVKLYLLARANRPSPGYTDDKRYFLGGPVVGPFDDNYKRHVFSTTVRLNNIGGRRDSPYDPNNPYDPNSP